MEEKRTLTIEKMSEAGASWADISARVKEMQKEYEAKRRAEEAAARTKAKKREAAAAARERFVTAFADWGIAIDLIAEEEKDEFMESIDETMDAFLEDVHRMVVMKKIFGQR